MGSDMKTETLVKWCIAFKNAGIQPGGSRHLECVIKSKATFIQYDRKATSLRNTLLVPRSAVERIAT